MRRWGDDFRPSETFADAVVVLATVWGWGLLVIALVVRIS